MNSLDYPGVGPEHSFLKDVGRAEYHSCTDEEALEGIDIMLQFLFLSLSDLSCYSICGFGDLNFPCGNWSAAISFRVCCFIHLHINLEAYP